MLPDQSVSNRTRRFNLIIKNLVDFYREPTQKLVYHLYEKGYTMKQVADILGMSKQAVFLQFPKENK